MRDKLKDKAYFDKYIDKRNSYIAEDLNDIPSLKDEAKAGTISTVLKYIYDLLAMQYSRGDSVVDVQDTVKKGHEVLQLRRKILSSAKDNIEPSSYEMYERLDLGTLFEILTILSFMVALHLPKETIADALKQIGHEGEDALLDLVGAYVGQGKGVKKSAYPKVYGDLTTLFFATPEEQRLILKHCVKTWYDSMKPIYWHDSHEGAEGAYKGYWCFEIALVVMLLDIDDSLVQDHPHYPADLVKHYRAAK